MLSVLLTEKERTIIEEIADSEGISLGEAARGLIGIGFKERGLA